MPQFDFYTYFNMTLGNITSFITLYFMFGLFFFFFWNKFFFIYFFKSNKLFLFHFFKLIKSKSSLQPQTFSFFSYFFKMFNNVLYFFRNFFSIFLTNKSYFILVNVAVLEEHYRLFLFIIICFLFSFLLLFIAKKLNKNRFYHSKVTQYECGFEAFSDARAQLTIHFYLIALLFVIFDVEVIYFIPWATNFYFLGTNGYLAILIFTLILIIGFIYEWARGVFEWPSQLIGGKSEFKENQKFLKPDDSEYNNKSEEEFSKIKKEKIEYISIDSITLLSVYKLYLFSNFNYFWVNWHVSRIFNYLLAHRFASYFLLAVLYYTRKWYYFHF